MWIGGFLTAVGFVAIAAKVSPTFLKRVLGYDWIVDLVATVGILAFLGGSGTISGMMIGVTTGLAISAVLFFAKKFWKYSKLEKGTDGKRHWVEYDGTWTLPFLITAARRKAAASTILEDTKKAMFGDLKLVN
jgi:hypothetical protein